MSESMHIAIIGAGPGGYVAALRARQLGARVTLIERARIGGVCLNWGCIPTKALLRAAEVLDTVREAEQFGVEVGPARLNWGKAQARKDQVVAQLVGGVDILLRKAGVEIVVGEARFTGPRRLAVRASEADTTLTPDRIIIATGSHPLTLPIPGADLPAVIGSDEALALPALPSCMLIVGGGAIGVEFASLFCSCGVAVTLVEMLEHLVPNADRDIGESLAWALGRRGVAVHVASKVAHIAPAQDGGVLCTVQGPGGTRQVSANQVLVAVGRRPNVEGLGLEVAGVRHSPKGIEVNERMETSAAGVYAIGDVVGGAMLAHVATRQGVVAVENTLGGKSVMRYQAVPACIFSSPPAATVGMSEQQAIAAGRRVKVGKFGLVNNGKAVADGRPEGFVKIVADERLNEVLGVHMVGEHASELILEGLMALNLEATLDDFELAIHPHPTLGEAMLEAALAAQGRALGLPARPS